LIRLSYLLLDINQDKIMKTVRWMFVLGIICGAMIVAGYRLSRSELEAAAAVTLAPARASLAAQATTIEEVEARGVQPVIAQPMLFEDSTFGYQVSVPLGWNTVRLSEYVIAFRSPDGVTQVKIEAVGPLPADGLAPFVDRSLGSDAVLSRQLLTVQGIPAERVITFSDVLDLEATTFYLDAGQSAFVVTGIGEQKAIEMMARSFTLPQLVAQR
jgi:hypothetical protein